MAAASRPVEMRRSSRVQLGQPISFSVKSSDAAARRAGTGRDISLGGMFIETDGRYAQGEQVVVYMTLPGSRREMTLPAVVRWSANDGMGVQFGLLGARDTHEIADFVLRPAKIPSGPTAEAPALPGPRMTRSDLLAFLRRHRYCVQASVSSAATPQAAVVGFAVSDDLQIVFDTIGTTRKVTNLRRNGHVALVVGWDEEQTVQVEGVADEPAGAELERLKAVYFAAWPDGVGRQTWKDITYVRVRPTWARYSDFRPGGRIVEFGPSELALE
jgi:hypothetical protein